MRRSALVLWVVVLWARTSQAQPADPEPDREPDPAIEAAALSKTPKLVTFVPAEYPPRARKERIEAEVVLLLDIDVEGKVAAVAVAGPAAPPGLGFDEAAAAAAKQFQFEPAEQEGVPVAVQVSYRYRFTLPPPSVINFAGVLRERGTRLPMAGVVVTVFRDGGASPIGFEATTDASGAFHFYDLAPGQWNVSIEVPGYSDYRAVEKITPGEAIQTTYYVERASSNPFDVTVTAPQPRREVSRIALSAQEIDKVPGAAGDPVVVVQNLAGVARAQQSSGEIVVRGSAPEDTRVFVDGAEVPLIYHFGGLRSVLPVGMLDAIEFYPGGFSPYYGRATGGIIDVQVKRLQPKKIGGYVDVSLLDTGLLLQVPLEDKGGIAISGRRSYLDAVLPALMPASIAMVSAPRYYDLQLLANYRPAPSHDVRALFFGSDDRLELLFENPADVDPQFAGNALAASTTFVSSLLTYRYVPSERFENAVRVSYGRSWQDVNAGQLLVDLTVDTVQLRDTARHNFGPRWVLTYGLDVLYQKATTNLVIPRPPQEGEPPGSFDPFDPDNAITVNDRDASWSPAAFVETEIPAFAGLRLLPGLRVDYFQRLKQAVAQPRLTARWELGGGVTAKGGIGLFAQQPTPIELIENLGNPALAAERALHYSAGLEYQPRPWITLDATGFYKQLSDLVSSTDAIVMEENGAVRPLIYDNEGIGRVYGGELVARHALASNLSGWLAYTLSRAERRDSGGADMRLFDHDQTHIFTAVASYALPGNWQVGGRFRFVSGNPITPIVSAVYDASVDRYQPVYGQVNSSRNIPFHQLDLRVDKRWVFQTWMLNAYVDVQNAYNRANPEGMAYSYDFRQSRPQQGLPILAILGARAEF